MNKKQDQAVTALHRAVQEVIVRDLHDPRIRGMISVTRLELSPDRSQATVHVSVLPAERQELAVHGLNHAAAHVRAQVGERIEMRRVPALVFRADGALKREASIHAAIERNRLDRETSEPITESES